MLANAHREWGMKMRRSACLAFGLLLFASSTSLAEPASPDPSIAAIDNARAATIAALKAAPLGFRRVLFVADAPGGFAIYDPRSNNVFKPGEPLIVYTEPVGITWQQNGDKVSSKLVVDFEVRSPDGQVLGGQKSFGEFALTAREPPIDYMAHVTINLTGASAGAYILGLTMHDTNSGKTTSADLPFEIK
jgi:hypothetical protein